MISQAGESFPAIVSVLTGQEQNIFLASIAHLNKWGWHKEAQAMMDLVCRLAMSIHIDWRFGDTPPEQDDKPYWLTIENRHSGHRFVELHTYYKGPGWDMIYATDKARYRIVAYCKATLPQPDTL